MIDFPANPTPGQQFTAAGVTWVWDTVKWTASGLGVAYLPLAGGTMLGPIVLAADPTAALQPATKQYVDGASFGGFVNKFRNGTMDVWQRGTNVTVNAGVSAYTADGWIVGVTGANITTNFGSSLNATRGSLVITGAAGVTALTAQQRIESYVAAPLAGKRVTVQFRIWNSTGATITPNLTTYYANSVDNFSAFTQDVGPVALQSVPVSSGLSSTVVAYTFNASANAGNGYIVFLDFGGQLNGAGRQLAIAEADIRVTPGWPVGLCANPPPPELRPIATETTFCQRYYWAGQFWNAGYAQAASMSVGSMVYLPAAMRASPTLAVTGNSSTNVGAATLTVRTGNNNFSVGAQSSAAGGYILFVSLTANAEL